MTATITLTVKRGSFRPERFVFRHPGLVTVGRSADCDLCLPNTPEFQDVSRHHCLLHVDPPRLRVSDFGSRNGTYVNGVNIGQRDARQEPEDVFPVDTPEVEVSEGDEIRLGHTVFRVGVSVPGICPACGQEMPDSTEAQTERDLDGKRCPSCGQPVLDHRGAVLASP